MSDGKMTVYAGIMFERPLVGGRAGGSRLAELTEMGGAEGRRHIRALRRVRCERTGHRHDT